MAEDIPFVAGDELLRLRRLVEALQAELAAVKAALAEAQAALPCRWPAVVGCPGGFVVSEPGEPGSETITVSPLPDWAEGY